MRYEHLEEGPILNYLVQARVMNRELPRGIHWKPQAWHGTDYSRALPANQGMLMRLNQGFGIQFRQCAPQGPRYVTHVTLPRGETLLEFGHTQLVANCIAALTVAEYLDREQLQLMQLGDGLRAAFEQLSLLVGVDESHLFYEIFLRGMSISGKRRPNVNLHGLLPCLDDAKFDAALLGLQTMGKSTNLVYEVISQLDWKPCDVPVLTQAMA